MPQEKNCRVILSDENIHFQEYELDGKLLTGDFWSRPEGFEFYYESVSNDQPLLVEIPWRHFHGLMRSLAEKLAESRGF